MKRFVVIATAATLLVPATHALFNPIAEDLRGDNSPLAKRLMAYAERRTANLNASDSEQVGAAAADIAAATRANVTAMLGTLKNASSASALVRAAYTQAGRMPEGWSGQRTNLAQARSLTALADATVELHKAIGRPLTGAEELKVRQDAAQVPLDAAVASALVIYATIDAMRYQQRAVANLNQTAWAEIRENLTVLSLLHRHAELDTTDDDYHVNLSSKDNAVIRSARQVIRTVDESEMAKGLDAIAQGIDSALSTVSLPVPGILQDTFRCTENDVMLVFASPACAVVIGGTEDAVYEHFNSGQHVRTDMNVVLIDFGGNDIYVHHAGGAVWVPDNEFRLPGVQILVDMGGGDDTYDSLQMDSAVQGAGVLGIGVLYDQGGDDYYAAQSKSPLDDETPILKMHAYSHVSQGSALGGAGLLIDQAGNDRYLALQTNTDLATHAQGAATLDGFGLLRDRSGNDYRSFNLSSGVNGGASQGFATLNGTAYLLDYGSGRDTYHAGQDLVQGAASLSGFAILHDDGGANDYATVSSIGCPAMSSGACRPERPQHMSLAGWSQGYADTAGTGILASGPGNDHYRIRSTASTLGEYEGKSMLAAGVATGFAVLLDEDGSETYDAQARSLGYGNGGMGAFIDAAGGDLYQCGVITCYGYGRASGLGLFYDGFQDGDGDIYPPEIPDPEDYPLSTVD